MNLYTLLIIENTTGCLT